MKRIADPTLSPAVRAAWGKGPVNEDVRHLLLRLIEAGRIESCVDLGVSAAKDTSLPDSHRTLGLQIAGAYGDDDQRRSLIELMLKQPSKWPGRVTGPALAALFDALGEKELVQLIRRTRNDPEEIYSTETQLHRIVRLIDDPTLDRATELRDAMVDILFLLFEKDEKKRRRYQHLDFVAGPLACLCDRQLGAGLLSHDEGVVRACAILRNVLPRKALEHYILPHFERDKTARSAAFHRDIRSLDDTRTPAECIRTVQKFGLLGPLEYEDAEWLIPTLTKNENSFAQILALEAFVELWRKEGSPSKLLEILEELTRSTKQLSSALANAIQRSWTGGTIVRQFWDSRDASQTHESSPEQVDDSARPRSIEQKVPAELPDITDWLTWRTAVCAAPEAAFSRETILQTGVKLHEWLQRRLSKRELDVWDEGAIAEAFNPEFAAQATAAFGKIWRSTLPTLWSRRPAEDRDLIDPLWTCGYCGLAAETKIPGWARRLSADEAQRATFYSTLDPISSPQWIADLVAVHPTQVEAILGTELAAQLKLSEEYRYLPALNTLLFAHESLQRLLYRRLATALAQWPDHFQTEIGADFSAIHLRRVLSILSKFIAEDSRNASADDCVKHFNIEPFGPLSMIWLRAAFSFDLERATAALEAHITGLEESKRKIRVTEIFSQAFGSQRAFDSTHGLLEVTADTNSRVQALGRLVLKGFEYIRVDEQRDRGPVFAPDDRDRAEEASGSLLSQLVHTPGPESLKAGMELADNQLLAYTDRLRLNLRKRVAHEAEPPPLPPGDIVALDESFESPPHTRDALFAIMLNRLSDLQHDISHGDLSDRRTLCTIDVEAEMQRTLSWRLAQSAKGSYILDRESEVADSKRPDIRLTTVDGQHRGVIEIKIADNGWSYSALEKALRDQLDGSYLRHERCRAGYLLLTYNGTKKSWKVPGTREQLGFHQLVARLNELARRLEAEKDFTVRLGVFGLDLRAPQRKDSKPGVPATM